MYYYEKENYREAKKQLRDEYAVCFKKAETYIRIMNYGIEYEENCMMQILDDFLSAQKEEKPLFKITGPDLRKFCDTIMKAEIDRLSNRKIFLTGYAVCVPLCLMLLVFFRSFLFQKAAFTTKNLNNLRITSMDIIFVTFILAAYLVKLITARIFFNYSKLMKIGYIAVFAGMLGFGGYILDRMKLQTSPYVKISFPVFLTTLILSIAITIACIVLSRRNRVNDILSEDRKEDTRQEICPEQVICPSCGEEHDYYYPRCPYCKHKYN